MRLPHWKSRQRPNWPDYLADRAKRVRHPMLKQFFSEMRLDPDRPIGETPMVAFDLETTGLDAGRHDIVSIGLVPFTLSRIAMKESRYWVVAPRRQLSNESVTFHHITHSEIDGAPDLGDVLGEVLSVMKGRLPVVHYRHVERPFLDGAIRERLGEGAVFPLIDTMSLEARRHRRRRWVWVRRLMGRPPASIRLHESRLRYNLPAYQGHHALTDALSTAELLQAQVLTHYSPETPLKTLWS
ncbi:3'-5' exonuclease [Larsenimonas suaedae]|uniref:3'-5' exonuclease n=1 Tax=Larsenimonas suaedae TaxID=1851019 RepID=A0ABU1GRN2_9GAMM|nr:3'-5' exonuclease [Larsenimonas suaedae]MCM2972518.1 3'-5' exonuclease [Larsenimonas suaedae]MDR5894686.1 3'-5' exonuclease [Larsenimonas suaedae]